MATERFGLPYIWVSWLCGALSGEDQCLFSSWFRAHYTFEKVETEFDTVGYNAQHKDLLNRRATELRAEGWAVTKENQNSFKLRGETAILAGKPDLIAMRGDVVRIVDVKTGARRNAHWFQVVIYLLALPRVRKDLVGLTLEGELCYGNSEPVLIRASELTPDVAGRIWALVRDTAFSIPPEKVPSENECGFCPIPQSECPERMAVPVSVGDTKDF